MAREYRTLEFSETFLLSFVSRDMTAADRAAILKALRLLDENELHPSLRVHKIVAEGVWSASASDVLRISFERLGHGRKGLLTCSKHYDR